MPPGCWSPSLAGPPSAGIPERPGPHHLAAGQGRGRAVGIQEPGLAKWASQAGQGGRGENAASFTAGRGSLGGFPSVQTLAGSGAKSLNSLHLGLSSCQARGPDQTKY